MAAQGSKWWRLPWRRKAPADDLDPDRVDLVVVAAGFDDAEASSAALERAASSVPRWTPTAQVVLRHLLLLPAGQVDDAVAVAAQDGYRPAAFEPLGAPGSAPFESTGEGVEPSAAVPTVTERAGERAGERVEPAAAARAATERTGEVPDARVLVLERVQVLDALHCSQERSRMAGLAQRRGGVALGWEALQPLAPPPADSP